MLLLKYLLAAIQKLEVFGHARIISRWRNQKRLVVVHQHIIGLRIDVEGAGLIIAPQIAHGFDFLATELAHILLVGRQRCFVVDIQRNKHVVFAQALQNSRIGPYRGFHLAAIHTAVPCKVDHHRLAYFFGIGQAFFEVEKAAEVVRTM